MGLDMRPMGKPKPDFESRFREIFDAVSQDRIPKPSFLERLSGKKFPTKEELLDEWFANQISSYETIGAPRVGEDAMANQWLEAQYAQLEDKPDWETFKRDYEGFYVIALATQQAGVPVYVALGQDENVFRGQFLADCVDVLGEDLVAEAWESKMAPEALDYGNRLMAAIDTVAAANNLQYLKSQKEAPDVATDTLESKVHIAYALAQWLVFYGSRGHGYEADF